MATVTIPPDLRAFFLNSLAFSLSSSETELTERSSEGLLLSPFLRAKKRQLQTNHNMGELTIGFLQLSLFVIVCRIF